ncbi:MAG TPA: NADH-quinone oxidoreductase subunit J [Holophaga sp.]|nr:NADH-quinone oxidoreductase subunit J [Holophaga sp.]
MFLAFAILTLAGALSVLWQRNLILAGMSLVLSFLGLAGLFVLLANPVAAALQLIVYSGAIVVLVLFVIMLLNTHQEEPAERERPIQRWLGLASAALLGVGAVGAVLASPAVEGLKAAPASAMTLQRLGAALFRDHLLGFEVAGLLLLAAMVAAVLLVKKEV